MKTCLFYALVTVVILMLNLATPAGAAEMVLYDFTKAFQPKDVVTTDAQVSMADSAGGKCLHVQTGHSKPWPGIELRSPGGQWDLKPFSQVLVKVRNPGTESVTVHCRVDNPGADGITNCITGTLSIAAGRTDTLKVSLARSSGDTLHGELFGMRGYPVSPRGNGTIDPAKVTQLVIFVDQPGKDLAFEIVDILASGDYMPPTAWVTDANPFVPFIDTFGQYSHKDWPGKIHSLEEMATRRQQESADLSSHPAPVGWDKYGGALNGPKLKAADFFRTQKVNGKWWLVDPDGHLFFSQGIDCVRELNVTPVADRENWFRDFPGRQPEFESFLTRHFALKGYYAGKTVECFSFAAANLSRKYGEDWQAIHRRIVQQRLRSWGINTIGNWSEDATRYMDLTPYTDSVGSHGTRMIEGSEGYWGKFPDVFDPGFVESLRRSMEAVKGRSADDKWCIGYFSDNEMSWGDETSLAFGALKSPEDQPAKKAFIDMLREKYGQIDKLNNKWGTTHASWDALRESREAPDRKRAAEDLGAFYTLVAEHYFQTVRDIVKSVAPHQLYLGCRFAAVNSRAAAAAGKFCDVVSYNLYRRSVKDFQFNGGADVPLMIGEFHFGALDRGMFHTGLVPTSSQVERAQAYKNYVLGAIANPSFVGCHWFEYQDEPVTGRVYDEENYQIGFVDVADTPYPEMIQAAREVARKMYDRTGK